MKCVENGQKLAQIDELVAGDVVGRRVAFDAGDAHERLPECGFVGAHFHREYGHFAV